MILKNSHATITQFNSEYKQIKMSHLKSTKVSSFALMKKRKNKVLELYKRNDMIVTLLANQSPLCDRIGILDSSIKLIKQLGEGEFNIVWEVEIDNNEYIAVKIPYEPLEILEEKSEKRETLEEYAKRNEKLRNINRSVTININGGDPDRIIEKGDLLLLSYSAMNCLINKVVEYNYNTTNFIH